MLVKLTFFCFAIYLLNQLKIEESLLNKEWGDYKMQYKLEFSEDEDFQRRETFIANLKFIEDTNSKNLNYTLAMNKYGHIKKHERPKLFMSQKEHICHQDDNPVYVGEYLPIEYDYTRDGVVSYVKDQDICGAGYAFSAVGAIESQFAIHTGILPDLSEQDVVSCSKKYGNKGCRGGSLENVFKYCTAEGISTTIDYPYTAKESRCHRNYRKYSYRCAGYRKLTPCDEQNLVRALYNIGPISISMNAMHEEFLFYRSGILDIPGCSSYHLDHAALAVGYNLRRTPYLLVKNSFDPNWGENGYFKIALFKNNMCGIATRASFPVAFV